MPISHPAGRRELPLAAFALLAALTSSAAAAPSYRVTFTGNDLIQSTPVHRSQTYPIGASNGTATFTGDGFAYPGHVGCLNRLDMTWSSGLSGGAGAEILCDSRATDFVVSGPAGPAVPATLHFRVRGNNDRLGGFAGNNAHGSHTYVRAELNGALNIGNFTVGNSGTVVDGLFTGQTGNSFDVAFSITTNVPVNSAFVVDIQLDVVAGCYGNVFNTNPGYARADVGNASGPPVDGDGLHLEEVGGVVMDLPAGYTLNSTSWGIVNNHFSSTVAVEPGAPRAELGLRVTPNPAAGAVRLELALPVAGEVRIGVFDASGRRVRTLAEGTWAAGGYTLRWDGRDAAGGATPAGVYFARLETAGRVLTRRIARIE